MSIVKSPFRNGRDFSPMATQENDRNTRFILPKSDPKPSVKKRTLLGTTITKKKSTSKQKQAAPVKTPVPDIKEQEKQVKENAEKKKCEKLAVIVPLKSTMKRGLKSKGISPVTSTSKFASKCEAVEALTTQFYNEIARKGQTNNFSGQRELDEVYPADYPMDYGEEVIDGIIAGVLTYISAVREKKEAGEDLSKVEETVNKGAETVEKGLQAKAKEQAEIKIGSWFMEGGWMWILGSIVALILVATVVKR